MIINMFMLIVIFIIIFVIVIASIKISGEAGGLIESHRSQTLANPIERT